MLSWRKIPFYSGLLINKRNLEEYIYTYFNEDESEKTNNYETWTPIPYYRSVKHAEDTDKFKVFTEKMPTLGKIKLYIYMDEGLANRIAYCRQTKMIIYKQKKQRLNGYSGVFVCDDKEGNKILAEMENPAHNEWSASNYKTHGEPHHDGIKAKNEISTFVNNCLDELDKENVGGSQDILKLEEYLSIPEDLTADNELEGKNSNLISGEETDIITNDETGSVTTKLNNEKRSQINPVKRNEIKNSQEGKLDEEGELELRVGETRGSDNDSDSRGDNEKTKGEHGSENVKRIIPLKYFRVIAEGDSSSREHVLLINSKEYVKEAEIEISVGTDTRSRNDEDLNIVESSKGIITSNSIKALELVEGINELKIRFDNNLKHSINISAYANN